MKKIFAIVLTLALVLAMGTTAFAADTLTDETTSTVIDVNAKYETDASKFAVISVDVEYGAMQFTYVTTGNSGVWDPATHTYPTDDLTTATGEWRVDGNSNKIVVTNHSNRDVNVTASAATTANNLRWGDTEVTVSEPETVMLNAGVEDAYDEASNTTFTVTVSGDLGAGTGSADYEVIGEITVTIEPLDTVTTA